MPILKASEKVERVRATMSIPKALAERIRRYVEYMDSRGMVISEDEIVTQAVTYALNSDKEFVAWEGASTKAKRTARPRAESVEPVLAGEFHD